jgi:hypothetical protein
MSPRKPKADTNYAAALAPFLEHDRSLQADMATTLAPDDKGHLPKAFREQKLDPANPWHWRQLLEHFAAREYGDRSAGRPKISHKEKIIAATVLLRREALARTALAQKYPGHSFTYSRVARFLKEHGFYPTYDEKSLRPRFSEARKTLKANGLMSAVRASVEKHGLILPFESESET